MEFANINITSVAGWFRKVLRNENVVLRQASALELLNYFSGYIVARRIQVYALEPIPLEHFESIILPNFDNLDIVTVHGLQCTSITQTLNDMLSDEDNCDWQALTEALGKFYGEHGESYDDLILEESSRLFFEKQMRQWGIECFSFNSFWLL